MAFIRDIFIAGGAGFIGSHFVERLLVLPETKRVTVFDNFSSGRRWHLESIVDKRLTVLEGELEDLESLTTAMAGHDTVIHLASNPDIARAVGEPMIDFDKGTLLTQMIVEAMRRSDVRRILYASGTGIYGDIGHTEASEDYGPLHPISTYGASKLAGESLVSAYAHMFSLVGVAFRFGNVVGPRQTHGVGFDFIRKLKADPGKLEVMGDGKQSKSYVHVQDIVGAVLLAGNGATEPFQAYNVDTGDYITVTEIAEIAINKVVGDADKVELLYTGGDRGWKGDVPVFRLNTDRIRALGWACTHTSRQAMESSIEAMLADSRLFPSPETQKESGEQ